MNSEVNKKVKVSIIAILFGFVSLYFAMNIFTDKTEEQKDYLSTEGKFVYTEPYSDETYILVYEYTVDDITYEVKTDSGHGIVPKVGTIKTVIYNPNNPKKAALKGSNIPLLIIVSAFAFILVGLISYLVYNSVKRNKTYVISNRRIIGVLVGLLVTGTGIGTYFIIASTGDSLSPIEVIKTNGPLTLIPLFFIYVGIRTMMAELRQKGKELDKKYYNGEYTNKL